MIIFILLFFIVFVFTFVYFFYKLKLLSDDIDTLYDTCYKYILDSFNRGKDNV